MAFENKQFWAANSFLCEATMFIDVPLEIEISLKWLVGPSIGVEFGWLKISKSLNTKPVNRKQKCYQTDKIENENDTKRVGCSMISVLSADEERLWSIVRANSLDFNTWTFLKNCIDDWSWENILKIRKVYDAFLAEFPLCYGYWKKYADHEARVGSIDKVMEVYERAVQGVTYSVDIWLHYCVFAISSYGDPETVRSED
ncbi:hypothetical protein CsSME_00041631 [Camellia sinensis var. sinensis]